MVKHIYVPTTGPETWAGLLADPARQWRKGYSARTLAACWEASDGWPPEIAAILATATDFGPTTPELLLAMPEYQVNLPPRGKPSQNDLFVLAKAAGGQLIALTVEGKVSEPFGQTIAEWNVAGHPGKIERLRFIREQLGLGAELPDTVRYQLLHRTVSALLLARRFNAIYAAMIVHSFSRTAVGFDDYQAFVGLFGSQAIERDVLIPLTARGGVHLYTGWASGDMRYLQV